MKLNFKTLAAFCALSFMMTGCSKDNDSTENGSPSPLMSTIDKSSQTVESTDSDQEKSPAATDCVIKFEEGKITSSQSGAAVSNNSVKITQSGVYELTGSNSDCTIEIDADKNAEITLLMNNVQLTSKTGSVIDCESAKTLMLFSESGTKNSLTDSESYTATSEDAPDAAVFTRSDLIIQGEGELSINGKYKDAVKCKDSVTISDGTLNITSVDDGITGKDSVTIESGTVNVTSGGDGIKSTNDTDYGKGFIKLTSGEVNITSETDGIQAEKELTVDDGKVTIKAGGEAADAEIQATEDPRDFDKKPNMQNTADTAQSDSESDVSQKGIKAGGSITINNGTFDIKSADDSIHSNSSVTIVNSTFTLSSCDDGIHADENLEIHNGNITVSKSYEGLEGKSIDISGGTISVKAADDGLNAAGGDNGNFFGYGEASEDYYIRISGGDITVDAGGDGIDSNGTIAQSGGALTVYGPTNSGNGAIDYEKSYAMSGGTLIALGASGMAQAPSTLSQPCLSVNANAAEGSKIEVRDGSTVILSTETPKTAQSLIFSSEKFKSGTEYGIYVNDELVSTVTAEDGVSGNGATGQGGVGGGRPNGGGNRPGGFPNDWGGQKPQQ